MKNILVVCFFDYLKDSLYAEWSTGNSAQIKNVKIKSANEFKATVCNSMQLAQVLAGERDINMFIIFLNEDFDASLIEKIAIDNSHSKFVYISNAEEKHIII